MLSQIMESLNSIEKEFFVKMHEILDKYKLLLEKQHEQELKTLHLD
jgi:hypothetical protein